MLPVAKGPLLTPAGPCYKLISLAVICRQLPPMGGVVTSVAAPSRGWGGHGKGGAMTDRKLGNKKRKPSFGRWKDRYNRGQGLKHRRLARRRAAEASRA